jgi:hypothetical protein
VIQGRSLEDIATPLSAVKARRSATMTGLTYEGPVTPHG